MTPRTQRPSVHQAVGQSVTCKQSHCNLQSVDLLEQTSLQDKEMCIINVHWTIGPQIWNCLPNELKSADN